MNAYTPTRPEPSEAKAHHMRMLQRLAELGMDLAEIAAHQAKTQPDHAQPPDPAEPQTPAAQPPAKPQDPFLTFARVSRVVTAAISLHSALEAGPTPRAAPRPTSTRREPNTRFNILQDAVGQLADKYPDARAEAHASLQANFDDDIDGRATLESLFTAVCRDLGLNRDNILLAPCIEAILDIEQPDPTDEPTRLNPPD